MSEFLRVPLLVLGCGSVISLAIGLMLYGMMRITKKLSESN